MNFRNRCRKCEAVIPWRKRAFFGNTYKPVVCTACSRAMDIKIWGSTQAADAAMWKAVKEELSL